MHISFKFCWSSICLFFFCCLCYWSHKKPLTRNLLFVLASRSFVVLSLTFGYLIHFELIFTFGIRYKSNLVFGFWGVLHINTTCWKTSPHWILDVCSHSWPSCCNDAMPWQTATLRQKGFLQLTIPGSSTLFWGSWGRNLKQLVTVTSRERRHAYVLHSNFVHYDVVQAPNIGSGATHGRLGLPFD